MTLRTPLLILATLAVTACTNSPFSNADEAVDLNAGNAGAGAGIDTGIVPGSANDPTSPAYFQQVVGDRVLFPVNESNLTATAQSVLDQQADFLLRNMEFTTIIEGHADEQGTREYNLALGSRRASAVRDYLSSRGIADARMRTVSYGKERPVQICSDEQCYSQNRRSVTVLSAGGAGL